MSFALSLAGDVVEVEAGATSPVGLTVVNRGGAADRFEVAVEGIDLEWQRIPVPTFSVEPGESRSEKVFLTPPRLSESVAGSYPFVVRVRSLESGEAQTAQGLLRLNAFHSLTLDIAPKKGVVSPTTKRNDFRLTVVNLGNSEHTLQLSAQDPDDRCAYEFESDQIVLGPGQQREVEMVADPKQTPLLSSGRLIGFSVIARSLNERNVSATAQAQLEQRSLLSPATLVGAALLIGAVGAWWTMRPVDPTVQLQVTPMRATTGDKVQIRAIAAHADHVKITVGENGEVVYDSVPTNEPISYELKKDGTLPVVAVATRGAERAQDTEQITVEAPPVVALPVIESFEASAGSVKVNTPFIVSWKARNATVYSISPLGKELGAEQTQLEIVPMTAGKQTYTLYAKNSEGKAVSKSVTVQVADPSEAAILKFSAEPATVKESEGGKTVVSWNVSPEAALVELKLGEDSPRTVANTGSQEITLVGKTSVKLIATDSKGRRTSRQLTVGYEKTPVAPPPDADLLPRIKDALLNADGLETKDVNIDIVGKTIVLKGSVPDDIQKAQAGQVAGDVAGPDYSIDNQLTLRP